MWQSHLFSIVKWFLVVGIASIIAYIAICIFLVLFQQRLIFFPSSIIEITPKNVNLSYEDVWLPVFNKKGRLIIKSSFTSIENIVNYKGGVYKFFPVKLLLNQKFDSISKLRKLDIPILLIHGTEDVLVPTYMSQELFAVTPVKIKDLYIVPGASHNNITAIAGDKYLNKINEFVNKLTH